MSSNSQPQESNNNNTTINQEQPHPIDLTLSNTINDEERCCESQDEIPFRKKYKLAIALTWQRQKKHLFTTWIHVPLGVLFLLVVCWGLRLAIQQAPFRFPAPVIAMMIFFLLLLILEYFSIKYPGNYQNKSEDEMEKGNSTTTKNKGGNPTKKRKRFVDPFMILLAPPCEFCLRNMSVMFTPSFILIPAREIIPGKEIGLLTAWFLISQILAFIFPIILNKGINYFISLFKKAVKNVKSSSTPPPPSHSHHHQNIRDSRRGSMATLSGVEFEKGLSFSGGQKLGPIATGLSGLTANVIAPVTHLDTKIDDDVRRQIESIAMEQARQQGVEEVICSSPTRGRDHHQRKQLMYDSFKPISDVSNYHHHIHLNRPRSLRSLGRSSSRPKAAKQRSISSSGAFSESIDKNENDDEDEMEMMKNALSLDAAMRKIQSQPNSPMQSDEIEVMPSFSRPRNQVNLDSFKFPATPQMARIGSPNLNIPGLSTNYMTEENEDSRLTTAVPSRRESKTEVTQESPTKVEFKLPTRFENKNIERRNDPEEESEDEEEEDDPVERLASWLGDLITPTIYAILFIIGIPLFFLKDFALLLFLAINILTFIAAITIVPPKIRRFLHPILSTSLATVLIIWAFAAMKGIGLKDCLNEYYSVGAKYSILWDPNGYQGSVPGAGDILFSTLDAGIVALAVPMYRYRKELWENLSRMFIILIPCAALSLFFWNYIARLMGMDPIRSLAFSARFMSTPLAIELAGNIGADESITVILVVITGVVAAILKEQFFYKLMRIKKDDYLTVGLTMGSTSGAIGASSLISTPRTMAIASLSFVIFGALLLVCTAIPPIVEIVRSLAGA